MGRAERGVFNGNNNSKFDETVGADDYVPPTRQQHWESLYHREPPSMRSAKRTGRLCKTRVKVK